MAARARRVAGREAPAALPDLARTVVAGEAVALWSTEQRGASNAKAKRELGWTPRYPSWREGFPAVYSGIGTADQPKLRRAARTGQALG
jgi:nucleoside-diphosphate-sugar epimerase